MLRYQSRALMRHQLMLYVALSKQSFDAPSVDALCCVIKAEL
jgi:hypothetical protein